MDSKEHFSWLKDNKLLTIAKNNFKYFRTIFTDCLKATDEDILIIGDNGFPDRNIAALMSAGYYFAAEKLGLKSKLVIQDPKFRGDMADEEVTNSLANLKDESIIVMALSGKLGRLRILGKSFRRLIASKGHRFMSTPSLGSLLTGNYPKLISSINIDYKELQKKAGLVKKTLDEGKELHVTTEKGTDLHINIREKNAISNDGSYGKPSSGGNLPVGEVYIAPRKDEVFGKVVLDGSVRHRHGTSLVKNPVELTIDRGQISKIKGGHEANLIRNYIDWAHKNSRFPWGVRKIGELGIGVNPNAKIIGATIIDEKALGTAHIGIGSNYWFGGSIYSIVHFDQVFKDPIIYVDGEKIKI